MDAINPHLEPSLTIPRLCAIMSISEPTYYKMKRKGYGPKETRIERTVTITYPHFIEWKQELEDPASPLAKALKQIAAKQHAQGLKAGAAAARSAKHVSNTQGKREGKRR